MKKGKVQYIQLIACGLVVIVLLCGIFTIFRRLTGTASTDQLQTTGNIAEQTTQATEEKKDNSIPITKLEITSPEGTVRVGKELKLDVKYEPADATNPELKWTCSEDIPFEVTEDGVLMAQTGAEKHTVTLTATTTDGSDLSASFDLRIYPEIDPSKPMVAITFDDGPNPDTTNPMLDALEENYAKATFFCLGKNVEYYPETVQREYALGMEVATHTYQHVQLTKQSASGLEEEITKALNANISAIGVAPSLMRPPYGSADKTVLNAVGSHGLCCVNWSLDTEDWKTKNADATYKETMKAVDGDVVLLHDIHEYNVDAVKRFVPDLIAAGYQLVTVSELYENRGETLEPGTIHFRTDPTTATQAQTAPTQGTAGAVATTEARN